jgi:hypothetical protein
MTFLLAAGVLAVTLLAGALIAPRSFHHLTFRMDACALESGDWGVLDSSCPDMAIAPTDRTNAHSMWVGKVNHTVLARVDRRMF